MKKKKKTTRSFIHPGQHWQDYLQRRLLNSLLEIGSIIVAKAGGVLINICMLGLAEKIKPVLM